MKDRSFYNEPLELGFKCFWKLLGLRDEGYSDDKRAFWYEDPKDSGVCRCWCIYPSEPPRNIGAGVMQSQLVGYLRAGVTFTFLQYHWPVYYYCRLLSSAAHLVLHPPPPAFFCTHVLRSVAVSRCPRDQWLAVHMALQLWPYEHHVACCCFGALSRTCSRCGCDACILCFACSLWGLDSFRLHHFWKCSTVPPFGCASQHLPLRS